MSPRKPQKAVHSTDPGQSGLWLLLTFGGGVAGASIPYFATHNAAWTTGGGTIGAAVGATAAAIPQFRDWVSTRSRRRQIAESAGVATDITEQPLESLRVHTSDRDITEFVPRDIQHQLVEHLNNGIPVLIEGPSMSGKTRLAIETIRSHWPEVPCWFPRDDGDIEKLLSSNQQPAANTVILLDDLDRFLSNQSLTLGLLNQWTKNSCIIIATMMHSQYVKHSDRANETISGWDAVNRFKTITLNPSLSTEELNVVKHTSYANQLSQIESIGLGPLLGCAEAVRAAFADELRGHSRCGTLIKAAADWRRIGLGPASKDQLISFSKAHTDSTNQTSEWDGAWKYATNPINNTVPLLRQIGDDRWEVLDIIADSAEWPLSTHTLALSLKTPQLSRNQVFQIMLTTLSTNIPPLQVKRMFEQVINLKAEDTTLLHLYAIYLQHRLDRTDLAQEFYRKAVETNPSDTYLLVSYADFLYVVLDNIDEANEFYQRAINSDPNNKAITAAYSEFSLKAYCHQERKMHFREVTGSTNKRRHLHKTPDIRKAVLQAKEVFTRRKKANGHDS